MTSDEVVISLTETQARSKSNGHRIEKLEESMGLLHKLTEAVAVLAYEQQMQTRTIQTVQKSVAQLQARAGKNWDRLIDKVVFGVVASTIGAIISLILTWATGG